MSLEQAIKHGKEYRKPYYKSGRFDRTCRPNGSCGYCKGNRFHSNLKNAINAEETRYDFDKRNILREIRSKIIGLRA